jgi:hypothetical protein
MVAAFRLSPPKQIWFQKPGSGKNGAVFSKKICGKNPTGKNP